MRVIVATHNAGKLAELRQLLPRGVELLSLSDANLPSPDESGSTFAENALIKARAAAPYADAALADDSGLVVDALAGEPGVHSARYAGETASDADNNARLLRELAAHETALPTARFVCAAALVTADGREWLREGTVEGWIIAQQRGHGGFGYDPLFEVHDDRAPVASGRTLAELTIEEKNLISHRSRAVRDLIAEVRAAGVFVQIEEYDAEV